MVTLQGNPINLAGNLPALGEMLPSFTLVNNALAEQSLADFQADRLILNIFPSVDTSTCAAAVRRFNQLANDRVGCLVLCISADLPFAQQRFCGAEGLEKVISLSAFRSTFGNDYGIKMLDGPIQGLLARAVLIADNEHKIIHSQLVPEITAEPDYDKALAVL